MRHKLRGLTLLEDALDHDDLPENSEAALPPPRRYHSREVLLRRAIEALTALAPSPRGRLLPRQRSLRRGRHCRTARRTRRCFCVTVQPSLQLPRALSPKSQQSR